MLRITGGFLKGRQISFLKNSNIRPTTDKNRSAIFSILSDKVVDADVLDVCCGTGAFGIEAISRGAKSATFIDRDTSNLLKNLQLIDGYTYTVIKGDFLKKMVTLTEKSFDIIFIDPPYLKYSLKDILEISSNSLRDDGILIVEDSSKVLPYENETFKIIDQRIYGDSTVIFFNKNSDK